MQLSVRRRGKSAGARGLWAAPGPRGRKRGPRRGSGKLNPALQPRRGALVALRLLRTRWASVLPAPGTSSRVPPAEIPAPRGSKRGPGGGGGGGRPRGGARSSRFGRLLVSKPNVKLTVSNRTSTSGWYFLLSLPLGKCRWGRCKGRGGGVSAKMHTLSVGKIAEVCVCVCVCRGWGPLFCSLPSFWSEEREFQCALLGVDFTAIQGRGGGTPTNPLAAARVGVSGTLAIGDTDSFHYR